ncbi:hypothetical protein RF11_14806 [Thelohanellus kitauei]|uniref:C2H2-type domain-containing protein n=1 Tax=Thelohanellus kitauei TaxID=669202 RepID=A0A0C2N6Z7_THEKT|nr:hypothetical protein RF11_14806 [Thelohanellus kitauei]
MERWAKAFNSDKSSKMSAKKKHAQQVQETHKRAAALQDQIEATELYNRLSTSKMKSDDTAEKNLLDQTLNDDSHISVSDLVCLLCQRKFTSKQVLIKHVTTSNLHLSNLEKISKNI